MKRLKTTALAAAMIAASIGAAAQENGRMLTFDEALAITYTNNPSLQAIAYEEQAAEQERRAAIGLRMPQIGVTGAYAYLGKDIGIDLNDAKGGVTKLAGDLLGSGMVKPELIPTIQGLMQPLMAADWSLTIQDRSLGFIGGEVTMPLFLGGKINAANRAARINSESASAVGDQTRNALVSELVERYFGLTLAAQVVEVRQQVADGVRRHLEDALALEKSGMIAYSERLYVEFKMAEAERELENARLQLETITAALHNTLGTEDDYRPVTELFVLDRLEDMDYYKQLAADRNPLLAQVELKRQLAQEGVKARRADFMPQVVAMGGAAFYTYQVTDLVPRWAVGVGVSFKIFDGLNREYKYSAARQTVRRVSALHDKATEDISVLVEKLYNQLGNYSGRIASIDLSVSFAEEYLKAKKAAFLEGMSSASDLIDAELNLARVRTERMQAAYEYDCALARLLEAAGISDEYASYVRRSDARRITFE